MRSQRTPHVGAHGVDRRVGAPLLGLRHAGRVAAVSEGFEAVELGLDIVLFGEPTRAVMEARVVEDSIFPAPGQGSQVARGRAGLTIDSGSDPRSRLQCPFPRSNRRSQPRTP